MYICGFIIFAFDIVSVFFSLEACLMQIKFSRLDPGVVSPRFIHGKSVIYCAVLYSNTFAVQFLSSEGSPWTVLVYLLHELAWNLISITLALRLVKPGLTAETSRTRYIKYIFKLQLMFIIIII